MNWFDKMLGRRIKEVSPAQPTVTDLAMLIKTYEIKPECKYVLWFSRPMSPAFIHIVRSNLARVFSPNQVLIISGMEEPKIFELDGGENGNRRSTEQHLVSHGESNTETAEGEEQ